jgi:hypothetical protein
MVFGLRLMQEDRTTFRGRDEDEALLRGQGRYVGNVIEAGQAVAVFVRSPHAFAVIRRIECEKARQQPNVLAVLTSRDMQGVGSISRPIPIGGGPSGSTQSMNSAASFADIAILFVVEPPNCKPRPFRIRLMASYGIFDSVGARLTATPLRRLGQSTELWIYAAKIRPFHEGHV